MTTVQKLEKLFHDLMKKIWSATSWPAAAARLIIAVHRDISEGYLTLRATSLVYTTLLALVPLLALCFSVLKGMGAHGEIEPFLRQALQPLGPGSGEIVEKILGFVDKIQVGVLGAVGVTLLLYSVLALMAKIEAAFNDIWRVPNSRSIAYRIRDYLTVLLIGPLFIVLSVGMTTSLQHAAFLQSWLGIDLINTALEQVFKIVPYILFMLAFAALYMFMPNTRVKAVPALIAGFLTGILWKALGWVFGLFIAGSASYAMIYSAFASVILFMIWIYMGWLIILACSCVCYYLQNPSNQSLARGFRHLSQRDREKLALQIVIEVGQDFYENRKGLDTGTLCRHLHMPSIIVSDIVRELVAARILTHTEGDDPKLIPARPFDTTTVGELLEALETEDSSITGKACLSKNVEKIIKKHVAARKGALEGITLKDMATGNIPA